MFARILLLFFLVVTLPVVLTLELPVIGNYILILSGFYAFAEKIYIIIVLLILFFLGLSILLKKRSFKIFDLIVFSFTIVDIIVCLLILLNEFNYVALQSILFDGLYLMVLFFLNKRQLKTGSNTGDG